MLFQSLLRGDYHASRAIPQSSHSRVLAVIVMRVMSSQCTLAAGAATVCFGEKLPGLLPEWRPKLCSELRPESAGEVRPSPA